MGWAEGMVIVKNILEAVDSASEHLGSWGRWLTVALVLVGTHDVVLRYGFNAPTVWAYETMMMMGGSIYALGWGYGLLHKSHIRVDIFFSRLSARGQAIADVVLAAIFFFPLMSVLVYKSIFWMIRAWERSEVMMESYWYPPAGPFRTLIALGICVLFLQGLAKFIRDIQLSRSKSSD
jgi:TRAP-type mannitol/chloroaromatic compound transport system permease small subunit